ncbi:MAG TPA: hypothetical protein GXX60_03805 [Anaerolineaceae bacterium]|nr:hypothetical protein [Anaerolineaceae bacterium]
MLFPVSIHASTREATGFTLADPRSSLVFQSTPPRGRRRGVVALSRAVIRVSIHASTREATNTEQYAGNFAKVSIHASTREATERLRAVMDYCGGFNPRLHAGGDPVLSPTRLSRHCFNPRLHAGGDQCQYLFAIC